MIRTRMVRGAFGAVVALGLLAAMPLGAAHAGTLPQFTTGVLPPDPGATGLPHNEDVEPGMAVDGDGTIWVASNVNPLAKDDPRPKTVGGGISGSDIWESTDHGQSFQFVAAPFNVVADRPTPAGSDTDIAVNPVKNSSGYYDIWVASLWSVSTSLAVSQDGGVTWVVNEVNGTPDQDRPWLAADGACTVYFSYHSLEPYDTVVQTYSLPPCTNVAGGSAVNPQQTTVFDGNVGPAGTNRFGKIVVDTSSTSPHQHTVYQPMTGCEATTSTGLPETGGGCQDTMEAFMGVSTDGGASWTDHVIHVSTGDQLYIWPITAAVSPDGTVWAAWMEGPKGYAQYGYVSHSDDGGVTWSAPSQISVPGSASMAYPTIAARAPGDIVVAWYGTDRDGGTDDVSVMGKPNTTLTSGCGTPSTPACTPASWRLWWGESTDSGATWTGEPVSGTIHTGVLCVQGDGCYTYAGDRNLFDDFGTVVDPRTGASVIAFTDDQPTGRDGQEQTDFAAEITPAADTPEVPSLPLVLLLGSVGAAALVRRRRTA